MQTQQDRFLVIKNLLGTFDVVDTQKRVTLEDQLSRTDARQEAKLRNERNTKRLSSKQTANV